MDKAKILSSAEGVELTEQNVPRPGGLTAVSYLVTSARTDDTWRSDDLERARGEFDSEVKRSREANNNRTNN